MQLSDAAVTTPEVKSWQGLHLLHFQGSACSQKVRIFLAEKGLTWESHPVDLAPPGRMLPHGFSVSIPEALSRCWSTMVLFMSRVMTSWNTLMNCPHRCHRFFLRMHPGARESGNPWRLKTRSIWTCGRLPWGFWCRTAAGKKVIPRCWKPMNKAVRRTPSETKKSPGGAPLPRTACHRTRLGHLGPGLCRGL